MSLYTHPIFVFIHYMKETETSRTRYDTPTKNRFIGTVEAGKSVHEAGSMFGIKKSSADASGKYMKPEETRRTCDTQVVQRRFLIEPNGSWSELQ